MAASFTCFPSSRCLYMSGSLRSAPSCILGLPPHASVRAPRRRHAVAARRNCSSSVRSQKFVSNKPGLHMYIYTTSRTSDRRRRASRDLPRRRRLLLGEFQHRFGRRPRRRVGICRIAMASSAWRKLCSSSLVEMLVGVSEASSKRATAVATHSKSVAMSFMARPGAGGLRGRN